MDDSGRQRLCGAGVAELTETDRPERQSAPKLVLAGREQEPILVDLLDAYAHELSRFHSVGFGADGRFIYRELPTYWRDPGKHAFFVVMDGVPVGFVLIKQAPSAAEFKRVWDVAEFFIGAAYRRRGVGLAAAHTVWRQLKGNWQVRVLEANRAALAFWERATTEFLGNPPHSETFEKLGEPWRRFSFESLSGEAERRPQPPVH